MALCFTYIVDSKIRNTESRSEKGLNTTKKKNYKNSVRNTKNLQNKYQTKKSDRALLRRSSNEYYSGRRQSILG